MALLIRGTAASVVAFALAGAAFAQAPGQVKKEMRAPNQVVETGDQDDALVEVAGQQVHIDPQTGRIRQPTPAEAAALADALEQQFGKRVEGLTEIYLANGAVAIQLDESFMEAITVTRGADGKLKFTHTTGLDQATRAFTGEASEKNDAPEKNEVNSKKRLTNSNKLETE